MHNSFEQKMRVSKNSHKRHTHTQKNRFLVILENHQFFERGMNANLETQKWFSSIGRFSFSVKTFILTKTLLN